MLRDRKIVKSRDRDKSRTQYAVPLHARSEDRRRSGFRARLAGTLIKKQERRGKNDQPYGFLTLSDPTGMFEVMMFSEVLVASRPLLEAGKSILLDIGVDWIDEELKLRALSISDIDRAAAEAGEGLRIYLDDTRPLNAIAGQMRALHTSTVRRRSVTRGWRLSICPPRGGSR